MQIHRTSVSQGSEAAMHFSRRRARGGAGSLALGPQLFLRKQLREIFEDSERLPDRHLAMMQDRHLAGRAMLDDLLAGLRFIKRYDGLLEGNMRHGERHPWPERPGGIILVADDEMNLRHGK